MHTSRRSFDLSIKKCQFKISLFASGHVRRTHARQQRRAHSPEARAHRARHRTRRRVCPLGERTIHESARRARVGVRIWRVVHQSVCTHAVEAGHSCFAGIATFAVVTDFAQGVPQRILRLCCRHAAGVAGSGFLLESGIRLPFLANCA